MIANLWVLAAELKALGVKSGTLEPHFRLLKLGALGAKLQALGVKLGSLEVKHETLRGLW